MLLPIIIAFLLGDASGENSVVSEVIRLKNEKKCVEVSEGNYNNGCTYDFTRWSKHQTT